MIKFFPIYFHTDGSMVEALQKSNFLKIAHGQTEWVMAEVIAFVSATRQLFTIKKGIIQCVTIIKVSCQ